MNLGVYGEPGNGQQNATASEIRAGVDLFRLVTPGTLFSAQGFTSFVQTADQTITSAGTLTIAHGLGRQPLLMFPFLRNVTPEVGYSAGDITPVSIMGPSASGAGTALTSNTTNILVTYGANTSAIQVINKTSGIVANISNGNWLFFVRAFA